MSIATENPGELFEITGADAISATKRTAAKTSRTANRCENQQNCHNSLFIFSQPDQTGLTSPGGSQKRFLG